MTYETIEVTRPAAKSEGLEPDVIEGIEALEYGYDVNEGVDVWNFDKLGQIGFEFELTAEPMDQGLTVGDFDDLSVAGAEAEELEEPEDAIEPVSVAALGVMPDVAVVVERGIKALISDDANFIRALSSGLTLDHNRAENSYVIQWPHVGPENDGFPGEFIKVGVTDNGLFEVNYSTSPDFNAAGITADYDEKAHEGTVRQAIGTLHVSAVPVVATLIGRLIRHVHDKRETEALLQQGIVSDIKANCIEILRKSPEAPLSTIADHQHNALIKAHFWPVSNRGTVAHMGLVVAKPAEGVLVLNSGVRATYMIHKVPAALTAEIKVGDAVSLSYGLDQRLGNTVRVGRPTYDAVEEKMKALQGMKKGRPLNDRRELLFKNASNAAIPAPAEIALDPRKIVVERAPAPKKVREVAERG